MQTAEELINGSAVYGGKVVKWKASPFFLAFPLV